MESTSCGVLARRMSWNGFAPGGKIAGFPEISMVATVEGWSKPKLPSEGVGMENGLSLL